MDTITPELIRIRGGLKTIPDVVFDHKDTLELLDLSGNQIGDLPTQFSDLKELRILFLSDNQFNRIPDVLAACPKLDTIAFKSNKIIEFDAASLPENTRWLMLTNNQIHALPSSIGRLTKLRKFAFAGNRLRTVPDEIGECTSPELIRVSANQLTSVPTPLLRLPRLSWVSFSGNEFNRKKSSSILDLLKSVPKSSIEIASELASGASGTIHEALFTSPCSSEPVRAAIKTFTGGVTSDGDVVDDMLLHARCAPHPNLIEPLGVIEKEDSLDLVMKKASSEYTPLGNPPSLDTCTRDTFEEGTGFTEDQIGRITLQIAETMSHLFEHDTAHGDLYAHNILRNAIDHVLLCDFGAATDLRSCDAATKSAIEKIEVRAFGCLVEDLQTQARKAAADPNFGSAFDPLVNACMTLGIEDRPSFQSLVADFLR